MGVQRYDLTDLAKCTGKNLQDFMTVLASLRLPYENEHIRIQGAMDEIVASEISERDNTISKSQKVDENALKDLSMHNMLEKLSKKHIIEMDLLMKIADARNPEMLASVGVPPYRIIDYRESTQKNK